jgi:uncharacterized protein with PIN domain
METRTYFRVVHLTESGISSFADQQASSIEEAREIIKTKKSGGITKTDKAYWKKQKYGIQRVIELTEWVEREDTFDDDLCPYCKCRVEKTDDARYVNGIVPIMRNEGCEFCCPLPPDDPDSILEEVEV